MAVRESSRNIVATPDHVIEVVRQEQPSRRIVMHADPSELPDVLGGSSGVVTIGRDASEEVVVLASVDQRSRSRVCADVAHVVDEDVVAADVVGVDAFDAQVVRPVPPGRSAETTDDRGGTVGSEDELTCL